MWELTLRPDVPLPKSLEVLGRTLWAVDDALLGASALRDRLNKAASALDPVEGMPSPPDIGSPGGGGYLAW